MREMLTNPTCGERDMPILKVILDGALQCVLGLVGNSLAVLTQGEKNGELAW